MFKLGKMCQYFQLFMVFFIMKTFKILFLKDEQCLIVLNSCPCVKLHAIASYTNNSNLIPSDLFL